VSSSPPQRRETAQSLTRRRSLIQSITDRLIWWPILAGACAVWFILGSRVMHRIGPDPLAVPAGIMIATAVGVTLWRWSARDAHRETLAAGTCPRCYALVTRFEERPRPGALAHGLQGWRCENCGLEEAEPLTPPRGPS